MKFQVFLIYYERGTDTEVDLRRAASSVENRYQKEDYPSGLKGGMSLIVGALRA